MLQALTVTQILSNWLRFLTWFGAVAGVLFLYSALWAVVVAAFWPKGRGGVQ